MWQLATVRKVLSRIGRRGDDVLLRYIVLLHFQLGYSNVVLGCNVSLGVANYLREKRAKCRITSDSPFQGYQINIRHGKRLLDNEQSWKVAETKVGFRLQPSSNFPLQ